jgi:hypothetical protein
MQDQPGAHELIDNAAELQVFFREGLRGSGQAEGKAQLRVGGRTLLKQLQYLAGGGAEAVGFKTERIESNYPVLERNCTSHIEQP